MGTLTEQQNRCCGALMDYARLGDPRPSVLLLGPAGVGKRTIARAVAASLCLDFVDVTVSGDPRRVREHLFGSSAETARFEVGQEGPGDLGISRPSLLFLSNLDQIDGDLVNDLHRALTRRIYLDPSGVRRIISDDPWIVGSLTTRRNYSTRVGPEHWLLTGFEFRIPFSELAGNAELSVLVGSILDDLKIAKPVNPQAIQLLTSLPHLPENCRSVRRWIEVAAISSSEWKVITSAAIEAAMKGDLRWLLFQMPYRGVEITPERVDRWAEQFPDELRATAIYLLGLIAERYYIGHFQYHSVLQGFIDRSGLRARCEVVFCRWQHMGKSAERVAHTLRNQANWSVVGEIDLSKPATQWPRFERPQHFIVADDFVGSGDSLKRIIERQDKVPQLLTQYPASDLRIFLVAGFERAIRRLQRSLTVFGSRAHMAVDVIYGESDRCFSETSLILTDRNVRERMRQYCERRFAFLGANMRLGYKKIGGLCVFFDTVPNNSLPVLWCDREEWRPLFPASGLGQAGMPPNEAGAGPVAGPSG